MPECGMIRATTISPTERTTLKRLPKRATYERDTIYQILDEGFVCHVGFIVDGQTVVIPTAYGRAEDILYIHGSVASRMLRALANGIQVCVTVTLVDGLVLARSAFHHSMNYRSVVVVGPATIVDDLEDKRRALHLLVEHIVPGRAAEARPPSDSELRATSVVRLPIVEGS